MIPCKKKKKNNPVFWGASQHIWLLYLKFLLTLKDFLGSSERTLSTCSHIAVKKGQLCHKTMRSPKWRRWNPGSCIFTNTNSHALIWWWCFHGEGHSMHHAVDGQQASCPNGIFIYQSQNFTCQHRMSGILTHSLQVLGMWKCSCGP